MPKFTDMFLKNLKPRDAEYTITEGEGFAIRVQPAGSKTFVFVYKMNGKKKRYFLGSYPTTTLAEAKDEYREVAGLPAKGIDPLILREQKKEKERKAILEKPNRTAIDVALSTDSVESFKKLMEVDFPLGYIPETVEELAAYYMKQRAKSHGKDWFTTQLSALKCHVLPVLGKMKINDVPHRVARGLISKIAGTKPGAASNALKVARQMYRFGKKEGAAKENPFLEIPESVPEVRPKDGERILLDHEIPTVWRNITASGEADAVQRALKMILVTLQRPGEIAQMHSRQINGHWWTIPKGVTKKKKADHRVYLTDTALELIGGREGFIFPSESSKSGHVRRATLDDAVRESKLPGNFKRVEFDRTELYEAIWSKPMVQVAADYEVSDKSIFNIARQLEIPIPPNGYWLRTKKPHAPGLPPPKKCSQTYSARVFFGKAVTVPYFGLEERWTPHDLRRTGRTILARVKVFGIAEIVLEELIDHKKRGMTKIYNLHEYDDEKQDAATKWEAFLLGILQGIEEDAA